MAEARTWETANADIDQRQTIRATMRIVANFDMRALEGRIYGVRGTERGTSADRAIWPTSRFTLTKGQIVDGQFTAMLTGMDSNPDIPFDKSVKDFIGHVFGEFYGPDAEEVGGVVTATRDAPGTADDRVLYGFIGGRKPDRLTGVNDPEALLMGVDRNYETNSTTLTALQRPTVESTDDGLRITYVVDGQTQTVELTERDFGSNPSYPTYYYKRTDGTAFRLWSTSDAFTQRRSLFRTRMEHVEVNGWVITNYDPDDPTEITTSSIGRFVYGNRTTDVPTTGTASYAGRMYAVEFPSDAAVSYTRNASVRHYRGAVDLTADFGSGSVNGSINGLTSRPGDETAFADTAGGLSFNATIVGNELSATDLSGTGAFAGYSGEVNGAFYGPGTAEVAGVFDGTNGTEEKLLNGYFTGAKQ